MQRYIFKVFRQHLLLILEDDPQSRLVVITIFTRVVRTSPLLKISQNKTVHQVKIVIATGGTVGLAEWIIDNTCLLSRSIRYLDNLLIRNIVLHWSYTIPVVDGPLGSHVVQVVLVGEACVVRPRTIWWKGLTTSVQRMPTS